MLISK